MHPNKYKELLEKLEAEEFEKIGLDAEVYLQILAIYLYQNKLDNAKLLWMRIPDSVKDENKKLAQLNLLNLAMHHNSYTDFFKYIKYDWPQCITHIIDDLLVKQREDLFTLLGSAYASIYEENLIDMTQMSSAELKSSCAALNWTHEQDGDRLILLPKPQEPLTTVSSDDQLLKLTEFVSFLEN